MEAGFPSIGTEAGGREEIALHLGGEIEVALQGLALQRGEMVETVADQRVSKQPVTLYGFVTFLAEAVSAAGHTFERGIDLLEQDTESGILRSKSDRVFEALFSVFELTMKKSYFLRSHNGLSEAHGRCSELLMHRAGELVLKVY
jgi:hypothetical protein